MRDSRTSLLTLGVFLLVAIAFFGGLPSRRPPNQPESAALTKGLRDAVSPQRGEPCADDPITKLLCGYYATKPGDDNPNDLFKARAGEILIALVPDPWESYAGYQFDTAIEALRSAAVDAGYEPDRFSFPWGSGGDVRFTEIRKGVDEKDFSGEQSSDRMDPHLAAQSSTREPVRKKPYLTTRKSGHVARSDSSDRVWPGAMLFRDPRGESDKLVLLVGESPVTGVQADPLRIALQRAYWLIADGDPEKRIRIIGPTFSGSAESLRQGLASLRAHNTRDVPSPFCPTSCDTWFCPKKPARVVTGAASGRDVKTMLERCGLAEVEQIPLPVDQVLKNVFERFEASADDTVLLVESGTKFAAGVKSELTSVGSAPSPQATATPEIPLLRYPLHIGQMRDTLGTQSTTPFELDNSGRLALSLANDRDPLDIPPPLFPRLTRNVTDIAIAQELRQLLNDGTQLVGIIGTNALDVGFMAGRVRSATPNAQIFVLEWDLLFTHPQLAKDMFGTWIFSSYDMGGRVARLSKPDRVALGNSTAAGVYEAAHRVFSAPNPAPTKAPAAAPLWVGVVGASALWPVEVPVGNPLPLNAPSRISRPTSLLWFVNLFGAYLIVAWYRRLTIEAGDLRPHPRFLLPRALCERLQQPEPPLQPKDPHAQKLFAEKCKRLRGQKRRLGLARVATFASLIVGLATALFQLYRGPSWSPISRLLLVVPVLGLMSLTATAALDLWSIVKSPTISLHRTRWVAALCAVATVAALGLPGLCAYIGNTRLEVGVIDVLRYERMTSLASGLTPLTPVLLLTAALAAMFVAHTRREWLPREWLVDPISEALDRGASHPKELPVAAQLLRSLLTSISLREYLPQPEDRASIRVSKDPEAPGDAEPAAAPSRFPVGGVTVSVLVAGSAAVIAAITIWRHWLRGRMDAPLEYLALAQILLLFALAAHGIGYSFVLWIRLRRFLRYLMWTPLVEAFDRLPQQLDRHFSLRLSSTAAFAGAVRLPLEQMHAILRVIPSSDVVRFGRELKRFSADAMDKHDRERALRNNDWAKMLAIETEAFAVLCRAALYVYATVAPVENASIAELKIAEINRKKVSDETDTITIFRRVRSPDNFRPLCEEFVATMLTSVMSFAFIHMKNMLLATSIAVILMLLAIASYPFIAQRALLGHMVILIGCLVGVVTTMLITMDTNEILSRISNRVPGKVEVDAAFLEPVIAYAGIPSLVALATYFPSLRQDVYALLGWFIR